MNDFNEIDYLVTRGICPSCTWRGDTELEKGTCPQCGTNWVQLTMKDLYLLRAERDALREALQQIAAGKVAADNNHPLGEYASMAGRFLSIAQTALDGVK
jgi:predicted  nucleic acid-binding Zn-ribbon protein